MQPFWGKCSEKKQNPGSSCLETGVCSTIHTHALFNEASVGWTDETPASF